MFCHLPGEPGQLLGLHVAPLVGGADQRKPFVDRAFHNGLAPVAPAAEHIGNVVHGAARGPGDDVHAAQAAVQLDEQDLFARGSQAAAQQHRHGAFSCAALAGGHHNDLCGHGSDLLFSAGMGPRSTKNGIQVPMMHLY